MFGFIQKITPFEIISSMQITQAALYENVLVALPTGLGKTFIASVVMYNFYRWYPRGKILFLAPTKPLVHQQIEACYKVMGFDPKDTTEMTGKCSKSDRKELWKTKRVFFATPQTIQSELCSPDQAVPLNDIKLLVIDEAHRAKKNYAYTKVVEMIYSANKYFRVLALSATPGRQIDDVIEVIQNLLISRVEIRCNTSIDVVQFIHKKNLKTVVVPLGPELTDIRRKFMKIIEPYMNKLLAYGVVKGNLETQSKNWIIHEQQSYLSGSARLNHPDHSDITCTYSVIVSLFHALELLERQGLYPFFSFFYENGYQKYFVSLDSELKSFLNEDQQKYAPNNPFNQDRSVTDECLSEPAKKLMKIQGHPKYSILAEKLAEFYQQQPDSKSIVFCEFRDSTLLVDIALKQAANSLIKSRIIVGQGSSKFKSMKAMSQKEQIAVMDEFRTGIFNTLIATSVCEEGIDVGDVDLIICFDVSSKNPTRFTQRIGRTGRQRIGQVMMLVTEGKEQNNLRSVLASKDDTNQKIANNSRIKSSLLKTLPLLIPPQFKPKCLKTFLKVPVLPEVPKKVRKNAKVVEKPEEGPSTSRNHNKENKKIPSLNKFFRNFDKNAGDNPVAEENCSDVSILMNTSRTLKMSPEDQFDCFHKKISNMKCTPARSTENMEASKVLMNEAYPKMLKKMILEKDKNFLKDIVESESLLTAMEMDDDVVDLDSLEKTRKSFKAVKCVFGSIENVKSLLKVGQQNFRKVSAINKFDKLFAAPISITNLQDIIEKCQNMLDQSYVDSDTSMRPQHIISDMDSEQPAFVQNESKYHEQTNTSWNSALATKNNIFNSTIKTPCSDSKKSHKPKSIKKVTTPISESPLLKYFQKTIIKRNSNCSTPKVSFTETSARSKLDEKAVLGYLGLSSIDDIWMDNDSDEEISSIQQKIEDKKIENVPTPKMLPFQTLPGTSRSFMNKLVESKFSEEIKENSKSESDALWFDDGMDEVLKQIQIPQESTPAKMHQVIVKKHHYTIPEILDIIDQIDDDEVIQSSQPMVLGRSGNRSAFKKNGYGDQESLFCDSESDIFRTNSATSSIMTSHNVQSSIIDNDEISNSSNKTVDYDYDLAGSSKENSENAPKEVTPTSCSILSKETKSPSIFNRNLNYSKLTEYSQSSHVLKPHNHNLFNDLVISPVSSKTQRSANNFENYKLIKPVATLSGEVLQSSQSPMCVRIARSSRAQIVSSDEDEIFATCKSTLSSLSLDEPPAKSKISKKAKSCKVGKFSFLDMEAGADGDNSSDEESGDNISGLICDTINEEEDASDADVSTIDMHAKYLESLRSPSNRRMRFGFKIPQIKSIANMSDIYSQIPNTADVDEYEEDSFLKIEDEHYSEPELDVLEQAEAILKARRRAKKLGIPSTKPKKRRIIESLDTDSEEDEVIQNRKKIKSTLA